MPPHLYWGLVQLAERQILTLEVKGSNPLPPAIGAYAKFRRAQ